MKTDAASLDSLHDLVLPPSVHWWPLAPGWYLILALMGLLVVWYLWRKWKHWRANAYRREALRQLAQLQDAPAVAELLRCTALAIESRSEIAGKTGTEWVDWLDSMCHETMPSGVRQMLSSGVYERADTFQGFDQLHGYTARWISLHQVGFSTSKVIPGE